MNRGMWNYIIDVLMAIAFIVSAITGAILHFFFQSGVPIGSYQEFLGIIKHSWVASHNLSSLILVILVVIHLILHWNWMVRMTKNIIKKKK